jgi:hypothetical protein
MRFRGLSKALSTIVIITCGKKMNEVIIIMSKVIIEIMIIFIIGKSVVVKITVQLLQDKN